jgi:amidase
VQGVFDPSNATLGQLCEALKTGRLTSERLVQHYLQRIERLNHRGPMVNALITLNPDALRQAMRCDRERSAAHRTALYGIPFVVKDNFDTVGLATSGGSAALINSRPGSDAFVVQKLLEQGGILLAKANMSELAASCGRLGYSSAGGQVSNPFNLSRDASGSSSGSAAAVAADFAPFALGTDTAGSVRAPASVTGLVGLRPTLGLASRSGVMPCSLSFDTPGILARNAQDVALVLDAIAGPDPRDTATLNQPARTCCFADARSESSFDRVRLGVVSNFRGANAEVDGVEDAALARLASLGAILTPMTLPNAFDDLWTSVIGPLSEVEFKPQFESYLGLLDLPHPKTLRELIDASEAPAIQSSATPVNPARLTALRSADLVSPAQALEQRRHSQPEIAELRKVLRSLFVRDSLQALVFSTMSCPATPRFDRVVSGYSCGCIDAYRAGYVAAALGFPEITVPAGRISANLPTGYSFLGLPFSEQHLLGWANRFHAAGPHLRPAAPDLWEA